MDVVFLAFGLVLSSVSVQSQEVNGKWLHVVVDLYSTCKYNPED